MKQKEKTLSVNDMYDGRILNLHVDDVVLPNGHLSKREVVDHKNGAGILALDNGEFVFVRQHRYAVQKTIVEIPAGLVEEGENPKETAFRELQEEVGLKPLSLHHVVTILPSPGFTNEATYIYFASEFEENKLKPDDDEFIEIIRWPIEKVRQLYKEGYFEDAKTVSALGYYFSNMI